MARGRRGGDGATERGAVQNWRPEPKPEPEQRLMIDVEGRARFFIFLLVLGTGAHTGQGRPGRATDLHQSFYSKPLILAK